MLDRLFDAVHVSLTWAALVPMTLQKNSVQELIQYIRAVHLDHVAYPMKLCSEDNGPIAG